MVGKWTGIGAVGLIGAFILTLMLRPIALFVGEERWVQVDGTDFRRTEPVSYSVNDGLHRIAGHWAYPALLTVTVPAGTSDETVRNLFSGSKQSLPAVLRMNGTARELLIYTSNPSAAAAIARAAGLPISIRQDPAWTVYRNHSLPPEH